MPQPTLADEPPEFPGRQAALRLGAAFLAALFLVLILVWRDNGQRAQFETTVELTAVGDTHFYPMPGSEPSPPYAPIASIHGQPLYPADFRRHEFRPDDMTRAGLDEEAGFVLYHAPVRRQDAGENPTGPVYFLKISPTEYLKLKPGRKPAPR